MNNTYKKKNKKKYNYKSIKNKKKYSSKFKLFRKNKYKYDNKRGGGKINNGIKFNDYTKNYDNTKDVFQYIKDTLQEEINNDIKNIEQHCGTLKNNNIKTTTVCSPPKNACNNKSLNSSNLSIKIDNNLKGPIRLLWSGWDLLCQELACIIADAISNLDNIQSMAIEQSKFPIIWLMWGTWDEQLENLKLFYKKLTKENKINPETLKKLETIRKELWDNISEEYAKSKCFKRSIVVVPPNNLWDKDKTLFKIELPQINDNHLVWFIEYDCKTNQIRSNLNGSWKDLNQTLIPQWKNLGSLRSKIYSL